MRGKAAEAAGSTLPCQAVGLAVFTYTAVPVSVAVCGRYFTCLKELPGKGRTWKLTGFLEKHSGAGTVYSAQTFNK